MGDNSRDTMGDNSTDPMDVSAGEETETEYFSEVANFDETLDHSIDSLQGSLNLPVFSLEQSTGLQGSRGFQIAAVPQGQITNQPGGSSDIKLEYVSQMYNQQQAMQGQMVQPLTHPAFRDESNNMKSFNTYLPQTSSNISGSGAFIAQGGFNIVSLADSPFVSQGSVNTSGVSYTFSGDMLGSIVKTVGGAVSEKVGEGEDRLGGQEPSEAGARNKSSPKGKGRKSRTTSSSSVELAPKPEGQPTVSVVQTKVEPLEPGSGEMAFKPSLLEEILTEKKLALLKSPEVMLFLQSQQENLAREKAFLTRHPMDS